jgi:hypothetical protein
MYWNFVAIDGVIKNQFILYNHLRLGLPSGLFPSGFPTNILYTLLISPFFPYAFPISSSLK